MFFASCEPQSFIFISGNIRRALSKWTLACFKLFRIRLQIKKKETRFWIRDAPLLRAQTRNILSELIFTGSKNVFYTDVYSGFLQFILFFYFDM